MISEFHQLSDKIKQLADVAEALRRENADLRQAVTSLTTENADLNQRIEEAYHRVSAILQQLPSTGEQNEETA